MCAILVSDYMISLMQTSINLSNYMRRHYNLNIKSRSILELLNEFLVLEEGVLSVKKEKNNIFLEINRYINKFYGMSLEKLIKLSVNTSKSDFRSDSNSDSSEIERLKEELKVAKETIEELRSAYIKMKRLENRKQK